MKFYTYNSKKMTSSFNNLLDLVVMLELGVFFYCQSKAKPHVLMSIYCNLMLLDIKSFLFDIHL